MTADGSLILVPYSGADGARGEPNLAFELWNRRGKKIKRVVSKAIDQYVGPGSPPGIDAQLAAQERAAKQFVDELRRKDLRPLATGVAEPRDDDPEPHHASFTAEGESTPSVTFDLSADGILAVTPRGHAPITRKNRWWRSIPTPAEARRLQAESDKGHDACFNPAHLRAPRVDLARRVAIVTIGYHGNDTCWEPDDDYTVVTW